MKTKKLVIVGAGETADIAYEYFTHDSPYEVVAFSVNKEFINQNELYGLPVVEFENLENLYSTEYYEVFVAISYVKLNRVRKIMYEACKAKGYKCANYISSKAFIWHNVTLGENIFIFENNVIQHKVNIGNNVILWSGNHIGHRSTIQDNVYLSSHCVVSGFCTIGANSFLGVNCTFNDNVSLAEDTVVGSGALIVKSYYEKGLLLVGAPARPANKTSYEVFNLENQNA
jgi:sugar O-acyltransferase (sialic acid O-acetyltransferase NeuD family)